MTRQFAISLIGPGELQRHERHVAAPLDGIQFDINYTLAKSEDMGSQSAAAASATSATAATPAS